MVCTIMNHSSSFETVVSFNVQYLSLLLLYKGHVPRSGVTIDCGVNMNTYGKYFYLWIFKLNLNDLRCFPHLIKIDVYFVLLLRNNCLFYFILKYFYVKPQLAHVVKSATCSLTSILNKQECRITLRLFKLSHK